MALREHTPTAALALILLVAAGLRIGGLFGDLWLDEVWSLNLAAKVHSPLGIITGLHHDNNHHFNTLWLWLMGDARPAWLYRVPALLAGIGTVGLLYLAGRQRGRGTCQAAAPASARTQSEDHRRGSSEGVDPAIHHADSLGRPAGGPAALPGLLAAAMGAVCYPLIHYSSESRGYAPAVFMAVLAMLILQSHIGRPRWSTRIGLWLTMIAGVLCHLTFLIAAAALVAWSAVALLRQQRVRAALAELILLHEGFIAAMAALYWLDLRRMMIGGGPMEPKWDVVLQTIGLTVGSPLRGPWAVAAAIAAAGGFAVALWLFWRRGDHRWVLFLVAVIVAPAGLVPRTDYLYPRYLLICVPFFLLAMGELLAAIWRTSRSGRAAMLLILAAFAAGNAVRTAGFLRDGRGDYTEALRQIASSDPSPHITLGGDHDFRTRMLVEYHRRAVPGGQRIEYIARGRQAIAPPQWYIRHSLEPQSDPPRELTMPTGEVHQRIATYRHQGLSGFTWTVYRQKPSPRPSP